VVERVKVMHAGPSDDLATTVFQSTFLSKSISLGMIFSREMHLLERRRHGDMTGCFDRMDTVLGERIQVLADLKARLAAYRGRGP